jgi:hypothetical protein
MAFQLQNPPRSCSRCAASPTPSRSRWKTWRRLFEAGKLADASSRRKGQVLGGWKEMAFVRTDALGDFVSPTYGEFATKTATGPCNRAIQGAAWEACGWCACASAGLSACGCWISSVLPAAAGEGGAAGRGGCQRGAVGRRAGGYLRRARAGAALPFLLLGFVPALRRRLPSQVPWLERFRRVLALPMAATAVALAWVLGRQVGVDGMALGLPPPCSGGRAVGVGRAPAEWRPLRAGRPGSRGAGGSRSSPPCREAARRPRQAVPPLLAERFSEARLAQLQDERRPVFVYFTADWCVSCKVNEKTSIDRRKWRPRSGAPTSRRWSATGPTRTLKSGASRWSRPHRRSAVPLLPPRFADARGASAGSYARSLDRADDVSR